MLCSTLWLIISGYIIFVDLKVHLNEYETFLKPISSSVGPVASKLWICASISIPRIRASISIPRIRAPIFKLRGKCFLGGRVLYKANRTASFQLERNILLCGDISINLGPLIKKPTKKYIPKYPCREFNRAVRNNQDAILCSSCETWSHVKCLQMSPSCFQYYLDWPNIDWPNIDWTCNLCALPKFSDSFFLDSSKSDCNASS